MSKQIEEQQQPKKKKKKKKKKSVNTTANLPNDEIN
jgi:hypothetical protein